MDEIRIKLAVPHQNQLTDPDVEREVNSIYESINNSDLKYADGTINFVFIKGFYKHIERKMTTAFLLVNKCNRPVEAIHGELLLNFTDCDALIAKATLDFDKAFVGNLLHDEALLVHLNIPVKGLHEDKEITIKNIQGKFDNVRVDYSEE